MSAPFYARWSDPIREPSLKREHASRSPVAKDRDRIVHSGAFRRLQRKSQIVGVQSNDFFRTRLTHTVECAQIGRAIALRSLRSDLSNVVENPAHFPDLVEAACLAHDLGHPPFGHNGELALQSMMRRHAGGLFEGNAQSLRIVCQLEPKVFLGRPYGLDLCATTLRAIVKYPVFEGDPGVSADHPKFCFYDTDEDRRLVRWLYGDQRPARTIATDVLEASDDIAYAVHDFEDGVWAGMIPLWSLLRDEGDARERLAETALENSAKHFKDAAQVERALERVLKGLRKEPWAQLPFDRSRPARAGLKNFCALLIGRFIDALTEDDVYAKPRRAVAQEIAVLKAIEWRWMIAAPALETVRFGQRKLIEDLFEGYWSNPAMLPSRERWDELRRSSGAAQLTPAEQPVWADKARLICDHVSGMTDLYALHVHAEMHQGGGAPNLRLI